MTDQRDGSEARRPAGEWRSRPPEVVALIGSPRREGNTVALVDAALDELERLGARCHRVLLAGRRIAPCLAHDDCAEVGACHLRDDAAAVLDQVYAADCLILATPVYYENVSAQMKAFIDRNYFRYNHEERLPARAVGLIAVAAETGLDDALGALRRYVKLSARGDVPMVELAAIADAAGDAAADAELLEAARRFARQLTELLRGDD
jgi:multimeric flavodoxin WrbA